MPCGGEASENPVARDINSFYALLLRSLAATPEKAGRATGGCGATTRRRHRLVSFSLGKRLSILEVRSDLGRRFRRYRPGISLAGSKTPDRLFSVGYFDFNIMFLS